MTNRMVHAVTAVLLMTCTSHEVVAFAGPRMLQKGSSSMVRTSSIHHNQKVGRLSVPLYYQKSKSRYFNSTDESTSTTVLKTALVDESSMSLHSSDILSSTPSSETNLVSWLEKVLGNSYWAPRLGLAASACIYGTNFALGAILDNAMPASAATCDRMVLAALALSPFVFQLESNLVVTSLVAGCFTSMGYITQSLALTDTLPSTVSFLGAATVIVCPVLQALVDKKPMGWKDAPQTWIAAVLCMLGVGILELWAPNQDVSSVVTTTTVGMSVGHGLALLQAVGFGTGMFLSSKMMSKHPHQALPITAVVVAMTALISTGWSFWDGWMHQPDWQSMALPQVLFAPDMSDSFFLGGASLSTVGMAVLWTGLISTSLNFVLEMVALGHVSAAEASVILATEPLWAALFASLLLGEGLGWNDGIGGFLIVSACLANTLTPNQVHAAVSTYMGNYSNKTQEN